MKCKYCKKESPCNKWLKEKGIIWFTKKGCLICDIEYFYKQLKLKELKEN